MWGNTGEGKGVLKPHPHVFFVFFLINDDQE